MAGDSIAKTLQQLADQLQKRMPEERRSGGVVHVCHTAEDIDQFLALPPERQALIACFIGVDPTPAQKLALERRSKPHQ